MRLSQLLGGRNYKKTVDIFFEAVLDGDGKEILKTLPDEMIEYLMEEEGFDSREEAEEELEDSIGNPKELSWISSRNDRFWEKRIFTRIYFVAYD